MEESAEKVRERVGVIERIASAIGVTASANKPGKKASSRADERSLSGEYLVVTTSGNSGGAKTSFDANVHCQPFMSL